MSQSDCSQWTLFGLNAVPPPACAARMRVCLAGSGIISITHNEDRRRITRLQEICRHSSEVDCNELQLNHDSGKMAALFATSWQSYRFGLAVSPQHPPKHSSPQRELRFEPGDVLLERVAVIGIIQPRTSRVGHAIWTCTGAQLDRLCS